MGNIRADIGEFANRSLFEATLALFSTLNIPINKISEKKLNLKDFFTNDNKSLVAIKELYAVGVVDDKVFKNKTTDIDIVALKKKDKYDALGIFAIELTTETPSRSLLAELTRLVNREMKAFPVAIIFKYGQHLALTNTERTNYKLTIKEGEKAGKVFILKDISIEALHSGHERILLDLDLSKSKTEIADFESLYKYTQQVLSVSELNKRFFSDLSNWYFWAMENVSFPDDLEKKKDVRNATNLIRLITRVVFIWFIKEKSLVPNDLFNKAYLDKILKDFNKNKKSQNYYHAILQNLFFGTLNQRMEERKFAKEGDNKTNKEEYGVKNLFRYSDLFNISEKEAMQLFKDVPFLNGGLFDCLDKPNEEGKIVYVDGFSRNTKKQASVPDYIFFGEEREVDLNDIYATKNKKYKSRGLINLLESYKFTVAENTPIEEEVALDPELLGKVFENLLASYNPETQTTARKQTGSFYTPREIVNYMVDESLLEYIKQNVKIVNDDFETRLRELISYAETPNPFDEKETKALIEGINYCKILDPACGSGAYPMGILHKMVHLLQKLDPENIHWKALQRLKAMEETEAAFKIGDKEERGKRLAEINDVFENNASDYGRKLYLIENCIYGIDIQPIAVQISKLRFFISLIIDQNKQATKENFGIRSLPNLETKFVAANTLIGLDKPAQTLLRNPEIEVKENQLKELRHKYFIANTRKEKLQYQKQDKKLRQEIAKMLESDGWQTSVAKQIVAFDPYDQNTFATWFDPEWMFGLTTGFDIVIGNPPYGIVKSSNTESNVLKRYQAYYSADFKINLFALFIERSLILSNSNSTNSFIIPDSSLNLPAFKKLRSYILKHSGLKYIAHYKEDVFESAAVGKSVILQFTKSIKVKDFQFRSFITSTDCVENTIELQRVLKDDDLKFVYKSSETGADLLLDKLKNIKFKLVQYCDIYDGINPGSEEIKDSVITDKKIDKYSKKIIDGKSFSKYSVIEWENMFVYYNEEFVEKLRRKIENKGDQFTGRIIKKTNFFEMDKIVTRQTADTIIATIDKKKYYVKNSVHSTIIKHEYKNTISLNIIIGILNSKIIEWYYRTESLESGRLFPQVKIERLRNLPIILPSDKSIASVLNKLVDYTILMKIENNDTSFFERLIDAMVYELYLPEEIMAGGAEVLKHLNNLPELKEGQDEKNIKTITKVYKELSDPKHPVSKAINKLQNIEEIQIIEVKNKNISN